MHEKKGRNKPTPPPIVRENSSMPVTPIKNQENYSLTKEQKEQFETKLDLIMLCKAISKEVPKKYPSLMAIQYQLDQILSSHNLETNTQNINGFEKEIYAIAGALTVNLFIARTEHFHSNHILSRQMLLQEQADHVLQNWLPQIKQPIAALRQAVKQPPFPSRDWFRSKLAVFGLTHYKAELACLDQLDTQLDNLQNAPLNSYEKLTHIHHSIRKAKFNLEKLDASKDLVNKLQQHLPTLPKIELFKKKEEVQAKPQVNEVHPAPIPSLDPRWKKPDTTEKQEESKPTVSSSPSQ